LNQDQQNRRGVLAMLAAMAFFVGNDVLIKLATVHFPVGQALALRSAFALFASLALVIALGSLSDLKQLGNRRLVARGSIEALVAVTFITALAKLPIGNINAILQASSIIIVALAAIMRIEMVGWRRWSAIIIGFVGVLFIVRPSTDGFNAYALLALFSAFLVAIRDLVTRGISKEISSGAITTGTIIMVGLAGLSMKSIEVWQPIAVRETLYLLGAALFVTGGNFAIVVAFRAADISLVSGFRYSILVFSIIAGVLIWGDWPDLPATIGSVLIVGSGLYAMHRQRLRGRQVRMAAQTGTQVP
jgi:drug/metabolite transporter (DMT)-like permease